MKVIVYIILIVLLFLNNQRAYHDGFKDGLETAKRVIDESMKEEEQDDIR